MKVDQRKTGVILSYAGEVVKILTNLAYTPIMLRLLGQSEYGLYQLVYSVVSYLGILNLGFGSAYIRFYSRYKAKNDNEGIDRLNGMFMTIFGLIALICLLCGGVMVGNTKVIFGSGLSTDELEKARILMIIMVINLAITFLNSVFSCILTSQERFLFQKSVDMLQNLISPFLTLPLLIMGFGSVGMVIATTILTFLAFFINGFYCLKKLHARFLFNHYEKKLFLEMGTFIFFIFLEKMIDQINWNVDKFLLGRITGTSAVAVYGIGGQINSMYLATAIFISNVFVPQVNLMIAEKVEDSQISKLFIKIGRIQFIVLSLVLTGIVLFGRTFFKLWAGAEYGEAYYVTLLLIIPVTVPMIQNLGVEIQRAKNKYYVRSIVYFFIAIGNIFISIPLIHMWGPTGAALGTAISLMIGNILFMNWFYYKHLGLDIKDFWLNIVKFVPSISVSIVFGLLIVHLVKWENILWLLFEVVVYTVFYSISMWLFGLNSYEKELVIDIKNKIVRKN